MDIREFRAITDQALAATGLERRRFPRFNNLRHPKIPGWAIEGDEVVRFFTPHAMRQPWGFRYSGSIGIEIVALRQWLTANKTPDEMGIFHTCFVGYVIENDDALRDFSVQHDDPIASDLWAALIRERLETFPDTVDDLLKVYRTNRGELGWLAHPHSKQAWDFLQKWREQADPAMGVPRMLPTGQIV